MKNKKEKFNYFEEFAKSVNLAQEAAIKLNEFVLNFDVNLLENKMKEIHAIENIADMNLHNVKNYLLKDFLPPIDREDILAISHRIDDLVDGIDEIVIDLNILNIQNIRSDMVETIQFLVEANKKVYEMIIAFEDLKETEKINKLIIDVNKTEEKADRLYENSIKNLMCNEANAIEVIKWTNIYEIIEKCFDRTEKIADAVEEVIMKIS